MPRWPYFMFFFSISLIGFLLYQQLVHPFPVADWVCHCLETPCRCFCVYCDHPLIKCSCGMPIDFTPHLSKGSSSPAFPIDDF